MDGSRPPAGRWWFGLVTKIRRNENKPSMAETLRAVLRFMLTGLAEGVEATTLVIEDPRPAAPLMGPVQFPKRLQAIVEKAMAEEPDDRYGSAQAMAADIERYLEDGAVLALPESPWTKTGRFLSKHRVAVILILAYVLARTFVLVFLGR